MNGFEQIKSFYSWVFNNPDKVRPTHISLYLFLLNQNNRSMWVEWFKCPYDLAMQGACIGNKNTYYKCLDDLQFNGLIEYKKGINNFKSPLIKLIRLYESEPLTEQVTVPQSEPQSSKQTVPQSEPLTELLSKNTYKLITNNFKLINDNEEKFISFLNLLDSNKKIEIPKTQNDLIFDVLISSISWLESTAMQSSKKLNVDQVKEFLKKYNDMINVQFEFKKNKTEYCTHFIYWLNKQTISQNGTGQTRNRNR